MNQNYLFFCQIGKLRCVFVLQNFSSYFMCALWWKRLDIADLDHGSQILCMWQSTCKIKCTHERLHFLKDFIYLLLEREREASMCGCLLCTPYWGPGLQPRHVPWLGTKPATLWFTSRHSIHWATPTRAESFINWALLTSPVLHFLF